MAVLVLNDFQVLRLRWTTKVQRLADSSGRYIQFQVLSCLPRVKRIWALLEAVSVHYSNLLIDRLRWSTYSPFASLHVFKLTLAHGQAVCRIQQSKGLEAAWICTPFCLGMI